MQDIDQEILLVLKEDTDDDDGYCCFDILEPYLNANRSKEISIHEISERLLNLVALNAVESFEYDKESETDNWIPRDPSISDAVSMWYRITSIGLRILEK